MNSRYSVRAVKLHKRHFFFSAKNTKWGGEKKKKKWRLGMKVHRRHLQCNPSVVKARRKGLFTGRLWGERPSVRTVWLLGSRCITAE